MSSAEEIAVQSAYHRELFPALFEWDGLWQAALDVTGDKDDALRLAVDQLGHFGPQGTELIADRLRSASDGSLTRLVELGSGFGGVLRQTGRILRSKGCCPCLIGVELVPEHAALGAAIARAVGDTGALTVTADVAHLPFASASIDAVIATGSASHFSSMAEVLVEGHRILRPGGVLAITEEVSLRPSGGPQVGPAFVRHHPPAVFRAASPEQRRAELEASGLDVEVFASLQEWAVPLLRQRVQALRLLQACATRMLGAEASERMIATLAAAADEYERGSVQPTLIIARRPSA